MELHYAYSVAAFAVGALVGLTGVGGGALMTPILLALGVQPATAVGTDLLYAAITKSCAIPVHQRRRTVQWPVVGRLALGSVPGAVLALWWLRDLAAHTPLLERRLLAVLGAALLLTAAAMLLHEPLRRRRARNGGSTASIVPERWLAPATVAAGAVLGVLVTLSSVGAGALGAMALYLLYPRLPTAAIVGTDIAHAVPLALVAGLGHLQLGNVDGTLLASLLLGSVPGIVLGTRLGLRLPEHVVRPLLASFLLFIGAGLVLRA
nr:sulfite exporter TauE/SafE family protein [Sulfurivermis fontis]